MVPHKRHQNGDLLPGYGDLGPQIGKEILFGYYRDDMGDVVK
jgi:hypothetical protein